MFTSEVQRCGVYMLTNRKTGDQYIGGSCDLATRMNQHRTGITYRSKKYPKRLKDAFPKLLDVEFRILEYVNPVMRRTDKYIDTHETGKLVRQCERTWISKLGPSLNKSIPLDETSIESLPHGAPGATVDPKEMTTPGK